ncbi:head-to-tail connector protein [Caulobacter phage Quill_5.2]|uniref:Head-to-tail connector protein n=1 Tax=Caulobacter phage Quill_5.2 TaxID=3075108 RepID=A0AA96PTV8_9CAUD|nr:head-to-tail connector protein [Caulobacter phage Quill_5.2]
MQGQSAQGRWTQLEGKSRPFKRRCETYAAYTIPKLCPPCSYNQETDELTHDFQAVGAQAVNHLANKIMLALFAPSRPFFRLDADLSLKNELLSVGFDEQKLQELLAKGEKEAIRELDRMAIRPKLYEAIKHLIVTGNVLIYAEDDGTFRVIGIKHYAVRRSMSGKVLEILHKDELMFDELDPDVQATAARWGGYKGDQSDRKVCLYRWVRRLPTGMYEMTQWLDQYQLPKEYNALWDEEGLRYRALTWDLSDDAHYGTGLVEDYKGDFAGLSLMSRSQIQGAVLASEFRWLVNPGGATRPEDFEESENGAAIPGNKDDVTIVQSNKSGDLQIVMNVASEYIQRIGRGFLLGTAVTRDAERVTAEEIRMQAAELETSLGGAYSRLAVDFQLPMAYWLIRRVGLALPSGSPIKPSIVTGMEALSRNGDLDDLKMLLADFAAVAALPPALQAELDMRKLFTMLSTPRRISANDILKTEAQKQAEAQAFQQQQAQMAADQQQIKTAGAISENQAKANTEQ